MSKRAAGILLPISSLPSEYGIGCFSKSAYDFVDWLKDAGQTYWQILPMGPTGFGDSPYQSFSTFAGNPYFISLEALVEEGVLEKAECDDAFFGCDPSDVDYEALYRNRYPLLKTAYSRSAIGEDPEFRAFVRENAWWLEDYALFMALKDHFGGQCWYQWPLDIRLRHASAMERHRKTLDAQVEFQMYLQFQVFRQYGALKRYANDRGIRIIGDIPIYVAMDSADVWANPELFQLNEENQPTAVAGCPPDAFAADGQLWGNPLYRWAYHRQTGYRWWLSRLSYVFRLYDVTRIDHFRGFDAYYAIPAGNKTAAGGHWEQGPGMDLFRTVREELGWHEVIAEDLGYVTDSVRQLVRDTGFPGMKVLEFAFDARDTGSAQDYLPHNYVENSVVYTGTHDNETVAGWLECITAEEVAMVRDYLWDHHTPQTELHKSFIALAMGSVAKTCIVPVQDWLGLDNSCRINQPSTLGANWRWRVTWQQLGADLQKEIRDFTARYGRLGAS